MLLFGTYCKFSFDDTSRSSKLLTTSPVSRFAELLDRFKKLLGRLLIEEENLFKIYKKKFAEKSEKLNFCKQAQEPSSHLELGLASVANEFDSDENVEQ